jgi:Transglycosylase SLT domain
MKLAGWSGCGVREITGSLTKNRFGGGEHAAMIDGAQRLRAAGRNGHDTVPAGGFGSAEKIFQQFHGEARHVAGDKQIPVRGSDAQGRVEASQRTAALDGIGYDGQAQPGIAFRRADQSDVAGGLAGQACDVSGQSRAAGGQQSLVAAHAGAGSAHQNERGPSPACWLHEMMLTVRAQGTGLTRCTGRPGNLVWNLNKRVYICFILGLVMLAASPTRAADRITVSSLAPTATANSAAVRETYVVRVDRRTGKLVRRVKVSAPATKPAPAAISALVKRSASAHGVDPLLVESVIKVESNYNPYAVSPKGAEGLMQLTPKTARMLGVSNTFDPGENIEAGVRYLKYLESMYQDDRLALAAYNAGPAAVAKYKWIPPYRETQEYVEKVGKRYGEARRAEAAKKAAGAEQAAAQRATADTPAPEETYPKLEQFVDADGRLHLRTTP